MQLTQAPPIGVCCSHSKQQMRGSWVLLSQADFPWIKLLRLDLMYIHTNHVSDIFILCNVCIHDSPMNAPAQWEELLRHPRWPDVVSRVFYINSVLDRDVSPDVSAGGFV